ncbi:alpha-ketoglutarate-dependent dioxygenase AlkB family protein [Mucilaginibacter phyllosphaerae]|uniref:Alkylated DNA repair dioxygenase AlkB n=1 Tax=Mucilaginibacter phyllosphaerae TaxID=1812349 RepID=A0A4Y8AHZ2_9SPHI|nr:alpha-ketoglutarate-dependent dioxygenase AlkB [Mucilaginibacter phyllosphaerae]MBB3968311.1 alkylated DNA repair dioxygenase AlkB [Mucilaginibacter phyllosphaerae]TEW68690.1 alpha-ketoglutarate-dependent dioxygenase AlkB [Mucilaginibacter phyllosphaerae]GGG99800.1 DNA methylase [Mucilaginibacter phyllosphaerae]
MEQLSFFDNAQSLRLPADLIDYCPGLFSRYESDGLLQKLKDTVNWQQETIQMYGKLLNTPRLTAWYGDNSKTYAFSGKKYEPYPWTPELLYIKQKVEERAGITFNSVLLNNYRNGNDSVAWHADDEPELGTNPVIASVSFGQSRRFDIRHKQNHKLKYAVELESGSLLIMKGDLQHNWEHQVPKSTKAINERINLTFRVIN